MPQHELPQYLQQRIAESGLSAVYDELLHREEINRAEMLFWKRQRQAIGQIIQSQLDDFSDVAEEAFNANHGHYHPPTD